MPELPEVETTLRGIKPHILQQKIIDVIVRQSKLRWPIPDLLKHLLGQTVMSLTRRGKYILFEVEQGFLLLHLGMSGRICVLMEEVAARKHDHVDIVFANGVHLRFTDPRRFGAILWTENPEQHPLLIKMGPEPLTAKFNADLLFKRAQGKRVAIKNFIMDSQIVAGVGNIYATEALFNAGIHPNTPASHISLAKYRVLVAMIKKVLILAIKKGGTTLKDFQHSMGKTGYFQIELKVYGKAGKPCPRCKKTLINMRIGQRGTVFCEKCQVLY